MPGRQRGYAPRGESRHEFGGSHLMGLVIGAFFVGLFLGLVLGVGA